MDKRYRFLKKKPRIQGVNGLFRWGFVEKHMGVKDAQENQICEAGNGHMTPYVDSKSKHYNGYVNKTYLQTSMILEEVVREANSIIVELDLIMQEKAVPMDAKGEEAMRQAALAASRSAQCEARKQMILTRLAEIKAECEMVDEALQHHIERATDILHSHISSYWRGVLKVSEGKMDHFPYMEESKYPGRERYEQNRDDLLRRINNALLKGGVEHEEE